MKTEQEQEKKKNHELAEQFAERGRQLHKLQVRYSI
jgi:hypothetical protein